ncbi:alpha/beta hydrolase [Leifsonia sp. McL0607]|uniref:alpha/beta hydrolase n=1 Tax=Leifsonia sp. McL0607 TaxID=3415672 RepID=UPI003CE83A30
MAGGRRCGARRGRRRRCTRDGHRSQPERDALAGRTAGRHWCRSVVERVLLVAPPSPGFLRDNSEVAAFAELPVSRPAAETRIVASDADPCCPEGAGAVFSGPLDIPMTTIPGGAHLTIPAGYGTWTSVFEWCLDPTATIVPR